MDPFALRNATRKPQSWNRFAYALNSPRKYTDPDGEAVAAAQALLLVGGSAVIIAAAVQANPELRQSLERATETAVQSLGAALAVVKDPATGDYVDTNTGEVVVPAPPSDEDLRTGTRDLTGDALEEAEAQGVFDGLSKGKTASSGIDVVEAMAGKTAEKVKAFLKRLFKRKERPEEKPEQKPENE